MTLLEGLQADLTSEHLSLVEYILTSSPWVRKAEVAAYERLRELRATELAHVDTISDAIESLGEVPSPNVFEFWRRDLNYLSIGYLVDVAIEHHEEKLTRYAARAEEAEGGWHDIATRYREMLADERRKLATLKEIASELAPVAPSEAEAAEEAPQT
jgi:FAD/FMN-containing dehydrogenase